MNKTTALPTRMAREFRRLEAWEKAAGNAGDSEAATDYMDRKWHVMKAAEQEGIRREVSLRLNNESLSDMLRACIEEARGEIKYRGYVTKDTFLRVRGFRYEINRDITNQISAYIDLYEADPGVGDLLLKELKEGIPND